MHFECLTGSLPVVEFWASIGSQARLVLHCAKLPGPCQGIPKLGNMKKQTMKRSTGFE